MVESNKWRWRNVEIVEKSQFISTAKPFWSLQQQHSPAKSPSVCHNFCVELYCCCRSLEKSFPSKYSWESSLVVPGWIVHSGVWRQRIIVSRIDPVGFPGPGRVPPFHRQLQLRRLSDQTQHSRLGESRLERREREREVTLRTIVSILYLYWNWSRKRPVQVGEKQWI